MNTCHIAFIDGTAPHSYTEDTFRSEECSLGATESSLIRLAQAFARSHRVTIFQYHRTEPEEVNGIQYRALTDSDGIEPTHVIMLRLPSGLSPLRERWPNASLYLWLHDLHTSEISRSCSVVQRTGAEVICVSQFHADRVRTLMEHSDDYDGTLSVDFIYLPLSGDWRPSADFDPNKIVFASTPSKGLQQVLQIMIRARLVIPELTLEVFNPGYHDAIDPGLSGVTFHGRKTNQDVVEAIGSALCLFCPQTAIPETFGMVFAESHAVGTPVLAHPFGSAPEMLTQEELVDCTDIEAVIDRLLHWHSGGRPHVAHRKELSMSAVLGRWEEKLCIQIDCPK